MSALAVVSGSEDSTIADLDLDLVAGVRAGDDRAFEQLFLRYQPRISAYVTGMVRDHARAEDITQEVFLSALRRLRDGTDREIQFRPWIYEIAKNKCIDAYRRGRHTVEVSFDAHEAVAAEDHGRLAGPRATSDEAVEDKLALDNLCGAFGGLSSVHHDILVMREFEGLSYREIGDRLGLSRPAVESTLFRARKRLSEEYEQLVSGERCRLVQRTVDASRGIDGAGMRVQRRIARHLAHCQPCRRYARLAGADLGELAKAGRARAGARIAALLPMPGFLRWGQVAGIDPVTVTGWTKAVATAAAVAAAGIGASSAISVRAGLPAQGGLGSPVVRVAGAEAGSATATRSMSGALQTSGAPAPPPAGPAAPGAVPAAATPTGADATASDASRAPATALDPESLTAPAAPARAGVPLGPSADGPVNSLLDRVIDDRGGPSSAPRGDGAGAPAQTAHGPASPLMRDDGLSRPLPVGSRPPRSSASVPASPSAPTASSAPSAPKSADTSAAASATAVSPSSEAAAAPTADGDSVRSTVHGVMSSTTATPTGLGG